MNLGEKIRIMRTSRYIRVERLAEYMNVHPNTIYRWERGERNMTLTHFRKFCRVMGLTPNDVLEGIENAGGTTWHE